MKIALKAVKTAFYSSIAGPVAVAVLFESGILEEGFLAGGDFFTVEYFAHIAMILLTLCAIPVALRLFKYEKVAVAVKGNIDGWKKYALLRNEILGITMGVNTLLYYAFINSAFGYLAIITLLAMMFVYPSESRLRNETELFDNEK